MYQQRAEEMVTELMSTLHNTQYHKSLYAYKIWFKRKQLTIKIQQLKEKGVHIDKIAKDLGITSAEVIVLLNHNNIDKDFFDNNDNNYR